MKLLDLLDLLDYIYKRAYINKRLFVEYEEYLLSFLALYQGKYRTTFVLRVDETHEQR